MSEVRLGYSVPGGNAVDIPIRHMAITGQTQEAGKTTALEALISNVYREADKLAAMGFLTKETNGLKASKG